MASKRKPIYFDTKLQALDEVDKKVKAQTQISKEYDVPCSTLSTCQKNKDEVILSLLGLKRSINITKLIHSPCEFRYYPTFTVYGCRCTTGEPPPGADPMEWWQMNLFIFLSGHLLTDGLNSWPVYSNSQSVVGSTHS